MTVQRALWMAVWIVGLLVVGCTPQEGPAVPSWVATPAPTSLLTFTPEPAPVLTMTKDRNTVTFTATRETATPSRVAAPSPTPFPTALTPEPTPAFPTTEEEHKVTFAVVYDNNVYDPALRTAWGFSCWIERGETVTLFDTGGDGATLLSNMAALDLDPAAIDTVVLSHIHGDHTGGLAGLLDAGSRPTVYLPAAFPASFKADVRARTNLVEVSGPVEISPGLYTTGQVGSSIIEQALVVRTKAGWVVVTGCAHPGIAEMVRRAKEIADGEVALVMGGFHLGSASERQIEQIIAQFRDLRVRQVAPCHCTGDRARRMFADAYGADCVLAGAGWVVRMD